MTFEEGAGVLDVPFGVGFGDGEARERFVEQVDDPLLFVEGIPFGETRAYVQRVVANYWIYQLRMGLATPTLDAIAAGDWAVYNPQQGG